MNAHAKLSIGHSVCPHDCPSTCALDVELLGDNRIGRVHGSADNLVPAADAKRLEEALGRRETRVDIDGGPNQLLLGTQRGDVLELVAEWTARR